MISLLLLLLPSFPRLGKQDQCLGVSLSLSVCGSTYFAFQYISIADTYTHLGWPTTHCGRADGARSFNDVQMKKRQLSVIECSDQKLRIPDNCCCGYEESDPTTATGRGFGGERVEQQEAGKILSLDPHWIGGGFLSQCLLLLQRSIHLSLLPTS
jgi:hypothetical protein